MIQFLTAQYLEANVQSASGGFCGEPSMPMRSRQSPQYLNARRYGQIIPRDVQSHTTDEFARCFDLARPWTPSMLSDEPFTAFRHCVALFTRYRRLEVGHDDGIGVECRKRLAVCRSPLP